MVGPRPLLIERQAPCESEANNQSNLKTGISDFVRDDSRDRIACVRSIRDRRALTRASGDLLCA